MVNAEILSTSLLMEDVLLSGFVEKSVYLRTDESPLPPHAGRSRQGSMGRRMSIASPSQRSAAGRKAADGSRRASDVGGQSVLC